MLIGDCGEGYAEDFGIITTDIVYDLPVDQAAIALYGKADPLLEDVYAGSEPSFRKFQFADSIWRELRNM